MICSPCLSDLHEFCRDDVRDCACDCARWLVEDDDERDYDDDAADDSSWQIGQDRYERGLFR